MDKLVLIVVCRNLATQFKPPLWLRAVHAMPWLHLILVEDASTDATSSVLALATAANPRQIRQLALETSLGPSEALRQGLLAALEEGERFVGCWSAHTVPSAEGLAQLTAALTDAPVVDAVFANEAAHSAVTPHRLTRALLAVQAHDLHTNAAIFRATPTLLAALAYRFLTPWGFRAELLARLTRLGQPPERCVEVSVGTQDPVTDTLPSLARTAFDLFRIRLQLAPTAPLTERLQAVLHELHASKPNTQDLTP